MTDEPEESTEARFRRLQEELKDLETPDLPDEEVDDRLRGISGSLGANLPEVPPTDDLEERLRAIEQRGRKAKIVHDRVKGEEASLQASNAKAAKGLGVGLAIAYTLLGLPMAGLGIGFLLNKATGGTSWTGLGTVLGAAAGILLAIVILNRENSRL